MAHEFVLRDQAVIDAPLERCFLLSTSIEIVVRELGMRPVTGRTSGLVRDGNWGCRTSTSAASSSSVRRHSSATA